MLINRRNWPQMCFCSLASTLFLRNVKGGNVMWAIINMLLFFWSIPVVLYLIMPALIVSVLLIMDLNRTA